MKSKRMLPIGLTALLFVLCGNASVFAGHQAGVNLYAYVQSQPTVATDPYGLKDYRLDDYDLKIAHDQGSGTHGATAPATAAQRGARLGWYGVAAGADAYGYDNAANHMRHYLGNSGSDLTVNYRGLISDVPTAQRVRDGEIDEAMAFAESQSGLITFPVSSHAASGGWCPKAESGDWYYAVNEYSTWGKGNVTVHDGCRYEMTLHLKFQDKYNWDAGKSVTIFGVRVPDINLGELHQAGIAQEYLLKGEVVYKVKWKKGERVGSGADVDSGGRGGGR